MVSTRGDAPPGGRNQSSFLMQVARFIGAVEHTPLSSPARRLLRCAPEDEIRQYGSEQLPGSILDGETNRMVRANIPPLQSIYQLCLSAESIHDTDNRSKHGAFFTPPAVAQRICRTFSINPQHRFLDPAAGSGIFLIARLEALLSSGQTTDSRVRASVQSIFGVERDEVMCRIARTTLALAIWQHAPHLSWSDLALHRTIRAFDALSTPLTGQLSWEAAFGVSSFDCIAGNPPFGISRDGGLSEIEKTAIRAQLAPYIAGKINKYMAFIARGYELLSHGGILSFITPNSWLGIASGAKLRRILIQEGAISRIERFEEPLFPELGVETDILTLQRSSTRSAVVVACYQSAAELTARTVDELPIALLKKLPDQVIPVATPVPVLDLALRLLSFGIPLGDPRSPVVPAIALQAYALGKGSPAQTAEDLQKRPYDLRYALDEHTLPYLDGRDVSHFRVNWRGNYLRWGPWLAEPQSLDRFRGPRILVREVLGAAPHRIHACYVQEPFLYNKSIVHLMRRDNADELSLKALTAILNSKIGSFLLSSVGRKSQRTLFPKLVLEDLNRFPFPSLSAEAAAAFARFSTTGATTTAVDTEQLDQLAYDLFSLSQPERAIVEDYLKRWQPR